MKNLGMVASLFGVFLLYCATMPTSVQGGDTGDILAVAAWGGNMHFPSYPLYALGVKLFASIPYISPVMLVSLFSVLSLLASLFVLRSISYTVRCGTAATAVGLFSVGLIPLVWQYAVVPEVFAFAALIAVSIVWLSLRTITDSHDWVAPYWLALCFSFGIAHHHSVIFLLPLVLTALGVHFSHLSSRVRQLKFGLIVTMIIGSGFLWYLTLLIPRQGWLFGGPLELSLLPKVFLRTMYLTIPTPYESWWLNGWAYLQSAITSYTIVGSIIILLGVPYLWRKSALFSLALLLSWFLSGPVFQMLFDQPAVGHTRIMLERFYVVPHLLIALPFICGIHVLLVRTEGFIKGALFCILGALMVFQAYRGYSYASYQHWNVLDTYLSQTLSCVPQKSVIIASGDSDGFGYLYKQFVEGYRQDVVTVLPGLLSQRWYRGFLRTHHPDIILQDDYTLSMYDNIEKFVRAQSQVRECYFAVEYKDSEKLSRLNIRPFNHVLVKHYLAHEKYEITEIEKRYMRGLRSLSEESIFIPKTADATRWEGYFAHSYGKAYYLLATEFLTEGNSIKANHYLQISQKLQQYKD